MGVETPMQAWIGIGANLGDPQATVRAAIAALQGLAHNRLVKASRLWRTRPLEASGPDYINAVARIDTQLTPQALLAELLALEQRYGRRRDRASGQINAPRPLDLDLLWMGDLQIDDPGPPALTLPHPRASRRAFVLAPLADIDPNFRLPNGEAALAVLARLREDDAQSVVPLSESGLPGSCDCTPECSP